MRGAGVNPRRLWPLLSFQMPAELGNWLKRSLQFAPILATSRTNQETPEFFLTHDAGRFDEFLVVDPSSSSSSTAPGAQQSTRGWASEFQSMVPEG